jgi:predicted secreted protein
MIRSSRLNPARAALILAAGGLCLPVGRPGAAAPPAPVLSLTVTEKNNNQKVQVPQGATFVISLAANHSAGYQWRVVESNAALLKPLGKPVYKPPQSGGPGAPGREVYRFTALKPGLTTVRLHYTRPSDHRGPLRTSVYVVRVTPKSS